jgi:hypothetical protein
MINFWIKPAKARRDTPPGISVNLALRGGRVALWLWWPRRGFGIWDLEIW